ncbi:MAG: O-antigen ligase family protein [Rhizobiales bacterium]|nr:O-antigen ligase family protein [Hyphomicrobiales bacterium]NRB13171.1 O-antigen ligase family protein [Hyphomicrobiales bacterium]
MTFISPVQAYKLSRITLIIMLVTSPILLGGNRHIFEIINLALAACAIFLFALSGKLNQLINTAQNNTRYIIIFMFMAIPLWMIFQASSYTPQFLHHPIWQQLGLQTGGAVSLNSGLTWGALMGYLSLSVVLIGIYMAIADLKAALKLQLICLIIINLITIFGLVTYLFEFQTLGIVDKIYFNGWLTATFVYKNAAANFIGFGMIICAVYLLELIVHKKSWLKTLNRETQIFIFSANFIILSLAQILTGSRGGVVSTLIGLFLILFIVIYGVRKQHKRKPNLQNSHRPWPLYLVILAAFILTAIALYYLAENRGGNSAIGSTQARLYLIADAVSAIFERPILGYGAGTYIDVEPLFHMFNVNDGMVWNKLHSTHMELMLTLGLPVMLISYILIIWLFIHLVRRSVRSSANWQLTLPAIAIITSMMVHASLDFTLQIPAIALFSSILVSLSFNQKGRKNPKFS